MSDVRILCLAGSLRKESLNKGLARSVCDIANENGARADFIDLADLDIPLYNDDLHDDFAMPSGALALKKEILKADGVFIASPEYNGSYSGVLKNALDWVSRRAFEGEPMLHAFAGKAFAIAAASPGAGGGLRGLIALRALLGKMEAHIFPNQLAIGGAHAIFPKGEPTTDQDTSQKLKKLTQGFIEYAQRLKKEED